MQLKRSSIKKKMTNEDYIFQMYMYSYLPCKYLSRGPSNLDLYPIQVSLAASIGEK